jgi:hypothetical protein
MSQFAILDPFSRKVRQRLPPNEALQDAQSGISEFRRTFEMPKPRSRFLILAACATLACLLSQAPAHAVTWLGFFPAIPTPPGVPPITTEPPVPPIFTWTEPPGNGGDQPTPSPDIPPDTFRSTPEPATIIGSLDGLGVLGLAGVRHRRKTR